MDNNYRRSVTSYKWPARTELYLRNNAAAFGECRVAKQLSPLRTFLKIENLEFNTTFKQPLSGSSKKLPLNLDHGSQKWLKPVFLRKFE